MTSALTWKKRIGPRKGPGFNSNEKREHEEGRDSLPRRGGREGFCVLSRKGREKGGRRDGGVSRTEGEEKK